MKRKYIRLRIYKPGYKPEYRFFINVSQCEFSDIQAELIEQGYRMSSCSVHFREVKSK